MHDIVFFEVNDWTPGSLYPDTDFFNKHIEPDENHISFCQPHPPKGGCLSLTT